MNIKLKEFKKIQNHMEKTFIAKNHDYGDDNIGVLGSKGVYVRMWDKMSRLKRLMWEERNAKVKDETIQDTLEDLANYAIIALIVHRGKWK